MKRVSRVASVGRSVEGGVILSNYGIELYNSFCETVEGLLKQETLITSDLRMI